MRLKTELKGIHSTLETLPNDIREHYDTFFAEATVECRNLEQGVADIRALSVEFAEYFCENSQKFVLQDHLKTFQQFCDMLRQAKDENEQFKKQEKRRLERYTFSSITTL